jgi:hypothetical protein
MAINATRTVPRVPRTITGTISVIGGGFLLSIDLAGVRRNAEMRLAGCLHELLSQLSLDVQ